MQSTVFLFTNRYSCTYVDFFAHVTLEGKLRRAETPITILQKLVEWLLEQAAAD